jgi:SAM-dependent methyltransferase
MQARPEWWTSFFGDLFVEVQKPPPARPQLMAEVGLIERVLRVRPPSRLLDVPCGPGRHALELAGRGFAVVAVDVNAAALQIGQQEARTTAAQLEWHCRDMRDLPWSEAFDGAFCFFGSFGYFDDQGNQEFLEAVWRTLRPGARFLLETHVAETLLPRFEPQGSVRLGEMLLLEERRYDPERGRIETNWTLLRGGRSVQRHSSIRLYTYGDLCRMTEAAGFIGSEAYEGSTLRPFHPGASRLSLVVTKGQGR